MDMIKSHLKTLLDQDYEYNIQLSLWDRFLAHKKSPKVKAKLDAKNQTASVEIDDSDVDEA